jgi:hypothetical protein
LRFGKMPTETNKVSDLLGHHGPARKSLGLPAPAGTAAVPESRLLLDISSLVTASFLYLATSHLAFGDDSGSNTDIFLSRIIMTATRTPEDESQIGSSFSQLIGEELRTEQTDDLKTALNTTPGVFALETGARGGVISLATHEGSGTPTITGFGEYGTYDSIKAGLISSGVIGKIAYSFAYVHDETANARPNNHLREDGYSFRVDIPLTDTLTIGVTARGEFGRYGEPSSNRAGGHSLRRSKC